jgi:hypothetical protein
VIKAGTTANLRLGHEHQTAGSRSHTSPGHCWMGPGIAQQAAHLQPVPETHRKRRPSADRSANLSGQNSP